jgi:hypothetical protein
MKDAPLKSTRRGFLKLAALGGSLPAIAGGNEGHDVKPIVKLTKNANTLPGAPGPTSVKNEQQIDHAVLSRAVAAACEWITGVAQMKTDTLSGERNSHKLEHRH